MHNMFTKNFSSPDKSLMCCARQFSFIPIVVFTYVKKSATKSAKMAVVITWYGLLNCHLRVYQMNEQTMCICKLSFVKFLFEILS